MSVFSRRLATVLVAAPLTLGLVACGTESEDREDAMGEPAPSTSAATTPSPAASSPAPEVDGSLASAARTALGAVSGSTLFSIDRTAGGWEVSVVTADGTESDVDVAADGTTITRGPVEETDDGDDATTDPAERQRLLGVELDYLAAIDAAGGAGTVTGVDLDEDNGTATWEVQYDEDTADEQTATLDATTGEVLRTERDD